MSKDSRVLIFFLNKILLEYITLLYYVFMYDFIKFKFQPLIKMYDA